MELNKIWLRIAKGCHGITYPGILFGLSFDVLSLRDCFDVIRDSFVIVKGFPRIARLRSKRKAYFWIALGCQRIAQGYPCDCHSVVRTFAALGSASHLKPNQF